MAWKKATYTDVRPKMKPGDIIAFGGKGNFSEIIKMATRAPVSHVGVIMQSRILITGSNEKRFFNQIIESTTIADKSGVQVNRLSDRLRTYNGEIWWLPLSTAAHQKLNYTKFYNWCLRQNGKPYDMPQAIKSALDALDNIPFVGGLTHNQEDFAKFFCSELATAALEKGGVIKKINSSEVTPIDLCRFKILKKDYYQIKATKKTIRGHNTQNPEGFGT